MRARLVILPVAVVTLTLPLQFSPSDGVSVATACGQTEVPSAGTCCPQLKATCVIGNYVAPKKYYLREGPCPWGP